MSRTHGESPMHAERSQAAAAPATERMDGDLKPHTAIDWRRGRRLGEASLSRARAASAP